MPQIGLLSDTHSWLDPQLFDFFADCAEVWHAGDFGSEEVADQLAAFRPLRGVYGNIDNPNLQHRFPLDLHFNLAGVEVLITHIGGYPGKYSARVRKLLDQYRPQLYICGHSHILKVMPDAGRQLLHINPGACGREGFHHMRTAVRFQLEAGRIHQLEVIELGLRGQR